MLLVFPRSAGIGTTLGSFTWVGQVFLVTLDLCLWALPNHMLKMICPILKAQIYDKSTTLGTLGFSSYSQQTTNPAGTMADATSPLIFYKHIIPYCMLQSPNGYK